MQYRYFLQEFKFDDFLRISILRKKRLFDDEGNEIPLADSISNYRCTLNPSSDINQEIEKISADEAGLDDGLIYFIETKLIPMINIAWDEKTIENYQNSFWDENILP